MFIAAAAEGDMAGMLEAGLEIGYNIFSSKLKVSKRGSALERHHSDPLAYGGLPGQDLTGLPGNEHSALHSALYAFMKQFGMNYKKGRTGQEVVEKFGRTAVLQKLADFYKGLAKKYPELTKVAEDFFDQHPNLK